MVSPRDAWVDRYGDIDQVFANGLDSNCYTKFEYPEDDFFQPELIEDIQKERTFKNLLFVLYRLTDKQQQILFLKAMNPEMSLRKVAKVLNISHIAVRDNLNKMKAKYPIFAYFLNNRHYKKQENNGEKL